ncbi:Hypothetical predicted protein [Pelobates cultripes]|uniref:Uncharacterized protein n=1 Tax=Pelobates cultripes TaxID=61616 RepID=A0AAD1WQ40_PELCU|nr:Hypothetical predicted protein [Pelobates cultripes]
MAKLRINERSDPWLERVIATFDWICESFWSRMSQRFRQLKHAAHPLEGDAGLCGGRPQAHTPGMSAETSDMAPLQSLPDRRAYRGKTSLHHPRLRRKPWWRLWRPQSRSRPLRRLLKGMDFSTSRYWVCGKLVPDPLQTRGWRDNLMWPTQRCS